MELLKNFIPQIWRDTLAANVLRRIELDAQYQQPVYGTPKPVVVKTRNTRARRRRRAQIKRSKS